MSCYFYRSAGDLDVYGVIFIRDGILISQKVFCGAHVHLPMHLELMLAHSHIHTYVAIIIYAFELV